MEPDQKLTTLRKQLILAALGIPTQQDSVDLDVILNTANLATAINLRGTIAPDAHSAYDVGIVGRYIKVTRTNFMDWLTAIVCQSASGDFRTANVADTNYIVFRSWDGAAYQVAMKLWKGFVDIPRAGDITFLANRTISFPTTLNLLKTGVAIGEIVGGDGDINLGTETEPFNNMTAYDYNVAADGAIYFDATDRLIFNRVNNRFRFQLASADIGSLDADNLTLTGQHILYSPHHHSLHASLIGGVVNVTIEAIPAGFFDQDMHVSKFGASVDVAPGVGNTVTVTLSNGVSTMTVTINHPDTSGETEVNAFDWDVSAQGLTLAYSQSAGGASNAAYVRWIEHHITNA